MDRHHIENIFDEMLEDVRNIKMGTYFLNRK